MSIGLATAAMIANPGQTFSLASLFNITPDSSNPPYIVVSGLDRNEYTAASNGNMGSFSGSGHSVGFTSIGSDGYGAGIVFTYDATTGQYTNATYGSLASVMMTASTDTNRNEAISLFAGSNLSTLNAYANNPYALEQVATYLGTVTVSTQPGVAAPGQATPDGIANVAMGYVGKAWNDNGCWVLASDIAAAAGASLPLTSTSVGIPGKANGEWVVVYNGPAGQGGDPASVLQAGDMMSFATSASTGHITTVVSGSGANALLVDNITYVNMNGTIANSANDGSPNDVIVAAPHVASQELAQAVAGSVVIYALDVPTIAAVSTPTVATGTAVNLASLFSVSDPTGKSATLYQVFDSSAGDTFNINGALETAKSAASALTVSAGSMATAALDATGTGTDTITLRAYNGSYWGDWQNLNVTASDSPVASSPHSSGSMGPVIANATQTQVWRTKQMNSFTLPTNIFSDPLGGTISYGAEQVGGPAAHWLQFDPASGRLSGRPTAKANGTIEIQVTATDSLGLSATETFDISIVRTAGQFRQAMASIQASGGVGAVTSPAANTHAHSLASPVA
jgi:hypothetical protein